MTRITEELIRKRAEHNECIISTLEEISLHQQDIEKIEYIGRWCKDLKILYLQSNLIPKIENIGRLKKLEYLNLALNNVEKIENLEGCESLKKLDLTVNFVGELTSIENLKDLPHFMELFMTGNPCTDYEGYRDYVIATLPHLQYLDGTEIEKSERILAVQHLAQNRAGIIEQQTIYKKNREKQKFQEEERISAEKEGRPAKTGDSRWYTDMNKEKCQVTEITEEEAETLEKELDAEKEAKKEEEKEKKFWEEKVPFTPESRKQVHDHMQEMRAKDDAKKYPSPDPPKYKRRLQDEDGRIYNVNEAKIDFTIKEDDENQTVILDVAVFKHLDTSLCDVDVQPTYVKVTIKGKVLQLTLPDEVKPDSSSAKRSIITGHLVITMPKAFPLDHKVLIPDVQKAKHDDKENKNTKAETKRKGGVERLEVDPSLNKGVDFGNIVTEDNNVPKIPLMGTKQFNRKPKEERPNSEHFQDDPDVPPLE